MTLRESATELTTAATDAILAVQCLAALAGVWKGAGVNRDRARLWCAAFALLALASLLGAVAHGFEMADRTRDAMWKPLFLCLGILVALFLVGAVHDWLGAVLARRITPLAIALGAAFFGMTEALGGAFLIFVLYEAVVMLATLGIYGYLAVRGRLAGAGLMCLAIALNLVAAGVQASDLSADLVVPFDHNGLFHLVQMAAVAVLARGVRRGMLVREPPTP